MGDIQPYALMHPALERQSWALFGQSLAEASVELVSPTTVHLHIPPLPLYRPQTPETLTLAVPADAIRSGRTTNAESLLVLAAGGASARLSGPLLDHPHEGTLQSAASNITITLAGDMWRQPLDVPLILSGLVAQDVPGLATGWDATFSEAVAAGHVNVSLIDEYVALVQLPPLRGLRLSSPEAVVVTIPADATVQGHRDIFCNPRLVLRTRSALLSGSLVAHGVSEQTIRTADKQLYISLHADTFSEDIGGDSYATNALLDGLGSRLRDAMTWHHVERVASTQVRLDVYSAVQGGYDIAAPETVVLVIPAVALHSNVSMSARPFIISAVPASAMWYPVIASPQQANVHVGEAEIQQDAYDYLTRVDLAIGSDDQWVPEMGAGDNEATRLLLLGFTSAQSEATGWNRIARNQLTHSAIERVNDYRLTIRISGYPSYDITEPETVRLSVPGAAVVSGQPSLAGGPDIVIVPARGSAALSGTLLSSPFEQTMQSVEGGQLFFSLQSDGFVDSLGQAASTDGACTGTLIDQLTLRSGQTQQPLGWENVVQATLRNKLDSVVVRESRNLLSIQLPQLLVYKLSTAETITAAIPGACLISGNALQEQHITGAPFRVLPAVGRAYLSGSLLTQAFEATVQTTSSQLTLNLFDDILLADVEAQIPSIIFGSLGSSPGSWDQVVQASLSASNVVIEQRNNGYDVTINIPAQPGYSISEPETVQVVVPASMLASEQAIYASPAFVIEVAGATGTSMEGSLVGGVSEASISSGTLQNITVTLEGDTWLNNRPSDALLEGLVSSAYEPRGWMGSIRPSLTLDHFRTISNTTMALYFRGDSTYDIAAPETIAVEVPAAACASGQVPGNVVKTFEIRAAPGRVLLDGAFVNASQELELISPESTRLEIVLAENFWTSYVGNDKWASRDALFSLTSQQTSPYGWNRVVRASQQERYLTRLSDSLLVLTLPQYAAYEISSPETLDVQLPGHLVSAGANLTDAGLLIIRPRPGRAIIAGGTLPDQAYETTIRRTATTVDIELLGDTWRTDLAPNATGNTSGTDATIRLLSAFACDVGESNGWNAEVLPLLTTLGQVSRNSDTQLTVTIPPALGLNISAPETIRLNVPAEAVASHVAPHMDLPAFVLRPERGHATMETPALSTEELVQMGSGVDAHGLTRLQVEGLADVSQSATFTSLNISLTDEDWSPSLLQYYDEEFEVCVYDQVANRTQPRLANISICAPSINAT